MQTKKGDIIEIDIHAMAFGGAGIGKFNNITVFVEKTMPGDKVKASLEKIKSNFMEAKLVEIVKESQDRITAPCKYFGVCGGCQFQFMPYAKQIEFKKQNIIDAFERIGKIYNPPVEDVLACDEEYYYRNKMEFSFGYDGTMNFSLGMHYPGRKFDILDLDICHLQSPFSVAIVNLARELAKKFHWAPFKYSNGEGFLKGLFIREAKRTGEVMINLSTSDHLPQNFQKQIKQFAEEFENLELDGRRITTLYWSKVISKRGFRREVKETLLFGKEFLTEKMILENGDELFFDIAPQAFFQVNSLQAEKLYGKVLELAMLKKHEVALDLFCGTGTIGLFLAKHVGELVGVELNDDAVKAARTNATKNNISNAEFFLGDVGRVLPELKKKPSLIIVDPPRVGLLEKAVKMISDIGPTQIIYVSCNPSTLARDCKMLMEFGYNLKSVQPVDMFPQTYHIEAVCLLEKD